MGLASETVRERETFRYDASLVTSAVIHESTAPRPPSELSTSSDPSLTAFSQLLAVRLGAVRALISLFDSKYQYVVAEATHNSPLAASARCDAPAHQLWLCGTAIPRAFGICEHVLYVKPGERLAGNAGSSAEPDLPVSVVPNALEDRRFSDKPYCRTPFYAGVPIRTARGITIGVVSIFDDRERAELDPASLQVMRDISRTVMGHLESKRSRAAYNRSQRMVRGLGSFVEGKSTISGWLAESGRPIFDNITHQEGSLNMIQQDANDTGGSHPEMESSLMELEDMNPPIRPLPGPARNPEGGPTAVASDTHSAPGSSQKTSIIISHNSALSVGTTSVRQREEAEVQQIFSKASNILRESIEVEGVVFVDASVRSFGGYHDREDSYGSRESRGSRGSHVSRGSRGSDPGTSGASNSEEDRLGRSPTPGEPDDSSPCAILGFSTSDMSSIDDDPQSSCQVTIPEKLLARLLRRYPEGKIFNFDENGTAQTSSDSSGDDDADRLGEGGAVLQGRASSPASHRQKRRAYAFSRDNESRSIIRIFPGARSVALVPLWDTKKQRWFAGGFTYTMNPARVFTVEGELSYLRAAGMVAMASVAAAESMLSDKAKTDVLNSLSHELRSPLHGLLLGAELLSDTTLDAFQGNVLHTVETCGRSLLDTIDHLLDFSKINNFIRTSRKRRAIRGARGMRKDKAGTIEAGMISLSDDVRIDLLAEEVVESLCFGFNSDRMSLSQLESERKAGNEDFHALRGLDSMDARDYERRGSDLTRSEDADSPLANISIQLDIDTKKNWLFHTQPGAVRRVLGNLFGNSLKYTTKGTIRVSLRQDPPGKRPDSLRNVRIVVADTGRGISEDYLRHRLFQPFSQENHLSPGAGLGLSLVNQIMSSLSGTIKIESRAGTGTIISLSIPMLQTRSASPGPSIPTLEPDFEDRVKQLTGLRVLLHGFPDSHDVEAPASTVLESGPTDLKLMEMICQDWLHMRVITQDDAGELAPDLVLCTERSLDRISNENQHRALPPTVTICRNVLVARQLSTRLAARHRGVFEFVSQPAGPRKLSKVLLLCFQRWVDAQAGISSIAAEPAPSVPPHRADENMIQAARLEGLIDVDDTITEPSLPAKTSHAFWTSKLEDLSTPRSIQSDQEMQEKPSSTTTNDFLLVDDNAINLNILTAYMKRLGHVHATAVNGRDALDLYTMSPGRFRVVLMDISMPVMDGLEATRLIRAFESGQNLRPATIIALTGLASAEAQQEAFASGINLFLTKPVSFRELTQILSQQQS